MDKRQYKTLKAIQKSKIYDYTEKSKAETEIIHFLAKSGYIVYQSDDCDGKLCAIKEEGRSALYDWRKERRRWFIPLVISILAAIGGYREELLLLIQAVGKLLRPILGD